MSLVANIAHDSIDLVLIKFDTSFVRIIIAPRLYIIEERHEAVVHVQLLVAVEKRYSNVRLANE